MFFHSESKILLIMKVLEKALCVLFFILTIIKFSVCVGICRENEQQALESLKKEVNDPSDILSSWIVGKDCCEWEGVVCHKRTRHVIELHLIGSGGLRINSLTWLPSLLNLENLEMNTVNLSKATNWLQVINMLPSLFNLVLYNCSLHHIPPLLHHNFSSLETLDLSFNDFTSPVPKWVFNLASLVSLDLSFNDFTGPFPGGPANLTSLTTFKAFGNSFNSLLPGWLFDLHNLEYLDLGNSVIRGALPSTAGNVTKLRYLDLSYNNINSTIPNWLYRCKNLEMLSLRNNHLEGEMSELFNGTSTCFPSGLGNCSSLRFLALGDNKLTGTLPESLGQHFPMLETLEISYNMLEGVVTESQFNGLTNLQSFLASGNNLTLKVSKNWIPPFQPVHILIDSWNIGPQFPLWLQNQKQVRYVDISNCGIEGEVPTWFWNLSSQMQFLNLSHNRFVGEVPFIKHSWQGGQIILVLGSNNFSGPLPHISPNVTELDLSNNYFSGGLSHFLCEAKNVSYNLEVLSLGKNNLSEEIPDCWRNWQELKVVILKENNLVGSIPRSMGLLIHLKSLDFRGNTLTGPLPLSLGNCTKLQKMDLAENEFVGQLPPWLGIRLSKLVILSLRSNKFNGELPPELCHLKDLQILDLANNNFIGVIPRCVSDFQAMITVKKLDDDTLGFLSAYDVVIESAVVTTKGNMYQYDKILALVTSMDMSNNNLSGDIPISLTNLEGLRSLNFSNNHLTGKIPNGIGNMNVLESIDLSKNQLTGQIPQSLSSLSTLSYLNLSHNNLSGMIPMSTQLQSFSPSSFQGNKLCGLPLLVNCSSGGAIPNLVNEKMESDEDEMQWFYISMTIGFALSFWAVSALLIFKRSWRHAYFHFLDSSWKSLLCKQA